MKYLVILVCCAVATPVGYFWFKPQLHSSKGKIAVAMTGRSSMELWFKHWNWPYPIRIKGTYRKWPIRYDKFSHEDMYFEYHALPSPVCKDPQKEFGQEMLNEFERILSSRQYNIAFFKFCFVDFKVSQEHIKKRFDQLAKTIQGAIKIAKEKKVKLIIGNALPMPESNDSTIKLQIQYNKWLDELDKEQGDMVVFDIFSPLVNEDGRLVKKLSRGNGDPHLGEDAFAILDKKFWIRIKTAEFF